jgi:hypothetical protein
MILILRVLMMRTRTLLERICEEDDERIGERAKGLSIYSLLWNPVT